MYATVGWYATVDFTVRFRATGWAGAAQPTSLEGVKDPVFQLLSWLRVRCMPSGCLRHAYPRAITDRGVRTAPPQKRGQRLLARCSAASHVRARAPACSRALVCPPQTGKVSRPAEWTVEPKRTERLLVCSEFFALRKGNAADALDAYHFAFFPRSGCHSPVSIFFCHGGMTVQLLIAVLAGAGRHITPGTALAKFQVVATLLLQLCFGLYCLLCLPAKEKLLSVAIGIQFLLEATRTGLLMLQLDVPAAAPGLQEAGFIL